MRSPGAAPRETSRPRAAGGGHQQLAVGDALLRRLERHRTRGGAPFARASQGSMSTALS